MSEELTRFPITPQERHRTARSSDDVAAVPEENLPRQEERPQDKPPPRGPRASDEDRPGDGDGTEEEEEDGAVDGDEAT